MTITIDSTSPQTGVKSSSFVSGNDIHLDPRLTINEAEGPTWSNPCVKVSGVAGLRPHFIIPKANIRKTWYAGNGWFSYDGLAWAQMGTTVDVSGTDIICQHNANFAQNVVWFSRDRREGVAQIRDWIDNTLVATYPSLISNLTGGTNYVVDNYSSQTAEDSRTVASTPLFGFKISSGGSGKLKFALTSGVHCCEDFGTTVYRRLIEQLCGSSTEAVALRAAFDFICLPLVNAPGREGCHTRSQWHVTATNHNDLNRHFSDTSNLFETITKPRAVLETELPVGQVGGMLDLHTQTTSGATDAEQFYYTNLGSPLESSFIAKFGTHQPRYGNLGAAPGGTMLNWAAVRGATIAMVVEHNESTDHSDAAADRLASYVVLTLHDMLVAGDFGGSAPPDEYDALIARMNTLKTEITMSAPTSAQAQEMIDIGNELVIIGNDILGTPPIVPPVVPPSSGSVVYVTTQETPLPDGPNQFQWKFASNSNIFRAAVGSTAWTQMPGYTGKLARDSAGQIMHFGGNGKWYRWTGSGWAESPPPV